VVALELSLRLLEEKAEEEGEEAVKTIPAEMAEACGIRPHSDPTFLYDARRIVADALKTNREMMEGERKGFTTKDWKCGKAVYDDMHQRLGTTPTQSSELLSYETVDGESSEVDEEEEDEEEEEEEVIEEEEGEEEEADEEGDNGDADYEEADADEADADEADADEADADEADADEADADEADADEADADEADADKTLAIEAKNDEADAEEAEDVPAIKARKKKRGLSLKRKLNA
jgi:hypothetical protein